MTRYERLQKLNKEATPGPWNAGAAGDDDTWELRSDAKPDAVIGYGECCFLPPEEFANGALIVECRNSLPAVLNLIEAALPVSEWDELPDYEYTPEECAELLQQLGALREAVAVFVSGQEEQP